MLKAILRPPCLCHSPFNQHQCNSARPSLAPNTHWATISRASSTSRVLDAIAADKAQSWGVRLTVSKTAWAGPQWTTTICSTTTVARASYIDPANLDGGERRGQTEQRRAQHGEDGADVGGELEPDEFDDVVVDGAAFHTPIIRVVRESLLCSKYCLCVGYSIHCGYSLHSE